MVYKTVSCKAVIAKVYRNFGIVHSGWENDAIEWIGDALSLIGSGVAMEQVVYERRVVNYSVKIPCALENLLYIEYNSKRLPPLDGIRGIRNDQYSPEHLPSNWYYLNPSFIRTSFDDQLIYIHALKMPTDEDGFPYVPDAAEVTEACAWFVLRGLISQGYKHPVFSWGDANISWETWQGRAYNKTIAPDLDRIEKIRQVWNQWCTDGRRGIRFMNPAKYGEVSNDYVRIIEGTPTIIRIGDDDDLELSTTV